jgi:hypothetical protein
MDEGEIASKIELNVKSFTFILEKNEEILTLFQSVNTNFGRSKTIIAF